MTVSLEHTCWRGMHVDHPRQWELVSASGVDEPGQCKFADRFYERIDLRWRGLQYVPNLDRMLTKYRSAAAKDQQITELAGAPSHWRGLLQNTAGSQVVHAVRFFQQPRLLAELTIVWPRCRHLELEREILASVRPENPQDKLKLWQAMGISATVCSDFELVKCTSTVGLVKWDFQTRQKRGPLLRIERLAMPQEWLKGPLRDWLAGQLPAGARKLRGELAIYNNHRGEQLISTTKIGTVSNLRGLRRLKIDVAWQCPLEGRLYRVSFAEVSRDQEIALPGHLKVRCCRPVPEVKDLQPDI